MTTILIKNFQCQTSFHFTPSLNFWMYKNTNYPCNCTKHYQKQYESHLQLLSGIFPYAKELDRRNGRIYLKENPTTPDPCLACSPDSKNPQLIESPRTEATGFNLASNWLNILLYIIFIIGL